MRGGVSYCEYFFGVVAPVFPTCVGVFPMHRVNVPVFRGLPHVRGGVSSITFVALVSL